MRPRTRRCRRASRPSSRRGSTSSSRATARCSATRRCSARRFSSELVGERARGRSRGLGRLGGVGPAERVRRARPVHCPAPSASATRSSATRPTRGSRIKRRGELHAKVGEAYERLEARGPRRVRRAALAALLPRRRHREERTATRSSPASGRRRSSPTSRRPASTGARSRSAPQLELDRPRSRGSGRRSATSASSPASTPTRRRRTRRRASSTRHPRLLLKEGVIRERFGRYAEALRWYNRGLRSLDELEPDEQAADALGARARLRRRARPPGRVRRRRRVVQARRSRRREPSDDLPAIAHAYYLMHLAYISNRSPERAALRGLALPIYEELGDLLGQANVLNNLGVDAYYEGRWQEALDLYEQQQGAARADRRRRRRGDDHEQHRRDQVRPGLPEHRQPSWPKRPASVFETAGPPAARRHALSNLGRIAARGGELDDGRTAAERGARDRRGDQLGEPGRRGEDPAGRVGRARPQAGGGARGRRGRAGSDSRVGRRLAPERPRPSHPGLRPGAARPGRRGARRRFEQSLELARAADETYELAVTFDAIGALKARSGRTDRPRRPRHAACSRGSASSPRPRSRPSRDGRIRTAGLLLPKQAR